ncbi:hypothetical protein APHMUC_1397 [Anaplasma phagocytophilum str. ApMUC09]|uniref:Uncharacterized protein n=1 Tax=Anaplasma phagocytophilum str. ApMUC09 TaxID=1359152 RepID=A0A0F3NBL5_ANAPH|nr:hypothetical protein APHMUC_1514 [Anaplasma phagocytophilum str. ApMUC09]KJV65087.1 hypothetical protein APHMUC_1397 [Anaplasma phagocytophilum str. ApMUC09]
MVYARVSKLFKILSQMRERLHVAHVGEIRAVSSTAVKDIEIEC